MKTISLRKREKGATTTTTWSYGYFGEMPVVSRHEVQSELGKVRVTHESWYPGTEHDWNHSLQERILERLVSRGVLSY